MAKNHKRYGMLINLGKCIGCFACQVACKAAYNIPFGIARCRVRTYKSEGIRNSWKIFIPHFCNHCDSAPCIESCQEKALLKNNNGVVVLNHDKCTGCNMCYENCPYNAIEVDTITGKVEKCDFCYEARVINGLKPVCVESCMGKAIIFGDINDSKSTIYKELSNIEANVLNPEFNTRPSILYKIDSEISETPLGKNRSAPYEPTKRVSIKYHPDSDSKSRLIYTSDAMCPSECGLAVEVEDGLAKKISGNPHSLINNGTLCAKGASGLQMTYSPHRIRTPLKRTGERGKEQWEEITWDEALDYIAGKLIHIKKHSGPESVFLDCGDVTDREAYYRLFHAFGTPNTYNHGSICDPNRRWGQGIMTGDERPLPDVQRPFLMRNDDNDLCLYTSHDAKLILGIGANPFVATRFNYMSAGIPAAREERGCKYIVLDPALTNSAACSDMWLPIRPGSDAAFLAAMLYYIIQHDSSSDLSSKYIDHDFMQKYTVGWQDFREAFLSCAEERDPCNNLKFFSPEWAKDKTGITVDNIKKISRLFGITKPASIEIGMHGTAHHTNGDVTSILMTALCLITGNIDVPGGLVFIESQKVKKGNRTAGREFLEKTVIRKIGGLDVSGQLSDLHKDLYGDFPAAWKGVLTDLPQKIREGVKLKHGPFKGYTYPVKAFITRAGNPVVTAGSTPDWIDAFTAKNDAGEYLLDLVVFLDTHITETGKYADIILPEAGFLERMGLSDVYTMSPEVAIRDQVIKPLHDSRTPFKFMMTFADALIRNGDPDIKAKDFSEKYESEDDFINELLTEAPGYYNVGAPLPYPELPEGCLIVGTPDKPSALWGEKVIKKGDPLTVEWLRNHNGVAVWPASYKRYRNMDGSPTGVYPRTRSHKFEFKFSYLEEINKKFNTDFPTTFYWSESKWNPKNSMYGKLAQEYPFQLISGRTHYAMTMTGICPSLAETETECMKLMNDEFSYKVPVVRMSPDTYGLKSDNKIYFHKDSVSIPVLAINKSDAEKLGIRTGDIVVIENPSKRKLRGKAYLTEEIMPGVIKTAFGPGGQKASGTGFIGSASDYTPNLNELFDPENISPFTGMPGFGDILVKVIKRN